MKLKHFWVRSTYGHYMEVGVHSAIPGAYESKLKAMKRIFSKGYTTTDGKIIDFWGLSETEKEEIEQKVKRFRV